MGINPDPFTFRELEWMAYGKRREDWDHTSLIAYHLHNDPQGFRKRLPITAFNPFHVLDNPESEFPLRITDPRDVQAVMGGSIEIVC